MPESCSWIASVSAVALANDLALQQKLELLYQLSNIILSNIILPSVQYSCKFYYQAGHPYTAGFYRVEIRFGATVAC